MQAVKLGIVLTISSGDLSKGDFTGTHSTYETKSLFIHSSSHGWSLAGERSVNLRLLSKKSLRALDHQMRRDILRYVGEGGNPTFTDIMNAIKIPDSPTLASYLRASPTLSNRVKEDTVLPRWERMSSACY